MILDIIHAIEYLWDAANGFSASVSQTDAWVRARLIGSRRPGTRSPSMSGRSPTPQ